MPMNDIVFISYAREDQTWAERLYMDLRKQEVNAWLDIRTLKAGANWKLEIRKAIRASRHFILLLSKHSLNKRGFVQREIREGIGVLSEFPKDQIFLIPVRLDSSVPVDEELLDLTWVDLMPNYHEGFSRILSALDSRGRSPLVTVGDGSKTPMLPMTVLDRGREVTIEMPLIVGDRAAVRYAPFRTAREFLQQFFDRLPTESFFADTSISYYFTIDTRDPEVHLGDDLKAEYPEMITLVFQNSFHGLSVRERGVTVSLAFAGVWRVLAIPYSAIRMVQIPEIGISIRVDSAERLSGAP